jgi:hypothetical protein
MWTDCSFLPSETRLGQIIDNGETGTEAGLFSVYLCQYYCNSAQFPSAAIIHGIAQSV